MVICCRSLKNGNSSEGKKLQHFPTLNSLSVGAHEAETYSKRLSDLQAEFLRRFKDFRKLESKLKILSSPFTVDVESAPVSLQLELIDLQSNTVLKDLFNPGVNIFQFFKSLNQDVSQLERLCQRNVGDVCVDLRVRTDFLDNEAKQVRPAFTDDG